LKVVLILELSFLFLVKQYRLSCSLYITLHDIVRYEEEEEEEEEEESKYYCSHVESERYPHLSSSSASSSSSLGLDS
jgi:hypothetical protein